MGRLFPCVSQQGGEGRSKEAGDGGGLDKASKTVLYFHVFHSESKFL